MNPAAKEGSRPAGTLSKGHLLPPLTYDYAALEPHIDARTMRLHHDVHHAGYVEKLNAAVQEYPELRDYPASWLLRNLKAGLRHRNAAYAATRCQSLLRLSPTLGNALCAGAHSRHAIRMPGCRARKLLPTSAPIGAIMDAPAISAAVMVKGSLACRRQAL